MTDEKKKEIIAVGKKLDLKGFHCKITYNFFNGKMVNVNILQSIKADNLIKGA